jgi:antitoxin ChpS
MTTATLRTLGGSVVLAIPPAFLEMFRLKAGSAVDLDLTRDGITLKPARKRYTLSELMQGIEEGESLPIDEAFEAAPPMGNEVL